eukprot:CAMPEP_0183365674 /NCGR_PEP_ID=MMETSP0164_2-20130417/85676_1 /TAXON_ID=221442 /ORGANISM="Coccolithus pelagicus ssp braarudi, Strain PLY182g" /LENGTH=39 /DNA_ID= /DNA_START= /DNA_END= /DNA_ORIENTATION=
MSVGVQLLACPPVNETEASPVDAPSAHSRLVQRRGRAAS